MQEIITQIDYYFQTYPALQWAAVVAGALLITTVVKLVVRVIASQLHKITDRTRSRWDNIFPDLLDGIKASVIFVWAFFLLSASMKVSESTHKVFVFFVVVATAYQLISWGLYVIRVWNDNILRKRITADPSAAAALSLLHTTIQAVFIGVIILVALSNLGINVTGMIAGLGIGGIAVALAAQNVLGDLLASLSIALDKPFVVGDFIVNSDIVGTVENIGIKTTRVRSLSGEQLIVSNKDLLESRVQNFKRMAERRVVLNIQATYNTPSEKLKQIPTWIRGFIEERDLLRFDRCHFAGYGDSSLNFELVFYVLSPDYNVFMDLQQEVLIDIFEKFEAENIRFGSPKRLVYIEKLPEEITANLKAPEPRESSRSRFTEIQN